MSSGELILHPPPGGHSLDQGRLRERLTVIGLAGADMPGCSSRLLVGQRFFQLITFLGCSPALEISPPATGSNNFCHLSLIGPFSGPRLLSAPNTRPPRCPHCGKGLHTWRARERAWQRGELGEELLCPECGLNSLPEHLNWRRKAGISDVFVAISQVFPEEAVPLPALLTGLGEDGHDWGYFYLQGRL